MIYLDNAATTKLDPEVGSLVKKVSLKNYANPGSSHSPGLEARTALENARESIAGFFNCRPEELIFTSGGSESNNLALRGLIKSLLEKNGEEIQILTTEIEHKSILQTAADLEKFYPVVLDHLRVDENGQILPEDLREKISDKTRLVSIIYVNNETGVVQPVGKIVRIIEAINKNRSEDSKIYLHLDAVQAVEYQNIDLGKVDLDLLSLSAHKFHGPKGVGLLYSRKNTPLLPIINGGGQEDGMRSGTENLPAITGMAKAIELINREDREKVSNLRDYFEEKVESTINEIKINGKKADRSPHISSICFKQAEGESIMLALDLEGTAVSTGSACNAKDLKASHVLTAMGLKPEEAQSTVRFSFSRLNSREEIDQVVRQLEKIIPKLRKISTKV